MKTIPIFFTFDNNYVVPAAVAFFSLLQKAKTDVFYDMYVIHSDITAENQELLQNIVNRDGNAKLVFINSDGFLQEEWKKGNFEGHNKKHQFTVETIIKLFAAKFFPQFDRIIFSDVDVVFMDDISELIEVDLEEKYLAGVKNAFAKYYSAELSHLSQENYDLLKDSYLAGGIWVMNLKKIREDKIEERMIEILKDSSITKRWPEQDVINIACKGNVSFLPLNYIAYPYLQDEVKKEFFISDFTREEIFDSIFNPKILHFAAVKPWNSKPRYADIWWAIYEYLELPRSSIFDKNKDEKPKSSSFKTKFYYALWKKLDKKLRRKRVIE